MFGNKLGDKISGLISYNPLYIAPLPVFPGCLKCNNRRQTGNHLSAFGKESKIQDIGFGRFLPILGKSLATGTFRHLHFILAFSFRSIENRENPGKDNIVSPVEHNPCIRSYFIKSPHKRPVGQQKFSMTLSIDNLQLFSLYNTPLGSQQLDIQDFTHFGRS